jgi:hypothetical protein
MVINATFNNIIVILLSKLHFHSCIWCRRGRDRMVVRFTTTCAISAYHHLQALCIDISLLIRSLKQTKTYTCSTYRTKRKRRDRMVVRFTTTCAISAYHH